MNLVEVPVALQGLIQVGIEIAVVFLLTQLMKAGFDFSGYKAQIVAAVFGAVMVILNSLLAKVPANLEGIVGALLNLLVVVLGSFGLYKLYRQFVPKK
jgi:hypothetical protein